MGDRLTKTGAAARLAVCVVLVLAFTAGCGSSSKSSSSLTTNTIDAGQVNIQLPPGWKVTKGGAIRPASAAASGSSTGASGASGASGATADTIPLAHQDAQTKFFSCDQHVLLVPQGPRREVHRRPRREQPEVADERPELHRVRCRSARPRATSCGALKDYGTFQDNLTPGEVKVQNKAFLSWRECMIGRGWGIPEPKPDSKGLLFSISGATSGGGAPNFTPPPGEDIITSGDVQECASETAKKVPEATSTTTGG